MKTKTILASALVMPGSVLAQTPSDPLADQIQQLGVTTALVVPSGAVNGQPLWSPDGNRLAANIMGDWYQFDMTTLTMSKAKWHGNEIGVSEAFPGYAPISSVELAAFEKVSNAADVIVKTQDGHVIMLNHSDSGSSLSIENPDKSKRTAWQKIKEKCHGLAISPSKRLVAYLCETKGLFVSSIR